MIIPPGANTQAFIELPKSRGIAFDALGRMDALDTDTVAGFPGPYVAGLGRLLRVNDDDSLTTIASGLVFPTTMTYGPDGALYVSNFGIGVPDPDAGQIIRIAIED